MKRVCCIIVTHNRRKYLEVELKSLLEQTYSISGIVLINNDSTDDTVEYLKKDKLIGFDNTKDTVLHNDKNGICIYYYCSSKNLGGAGGFKKGIEVAYSLDYDYFWIMDDDVAPTNNCLEKLLACNNEEKFGVIIPRRIGEGFTDLIVKKYRFGNPFVHIFFNRCVLQKNKKEINETKVFTFEGPLIKKEIIEKVGLPNDRYFLQGDDYDYAFRCLKFTKFAYIYSAIIYRQIPLQTFNDTPSLRDYYGARNMALLDIRYCTNFLAKYLRPRFLKLRWWFYCIFKKKDHKKWNYIKSGINDALIGLDGKKTDF